MSPCRLRISFSLPADNRRMPDQGRCHCRTLFKDAHKNLIFFGSSGQIDDAGRCWQTKIKVIIQEYQLNAHVKTCHPTRHPSRSREDRRRGNGRGSERLRSASYRDLCEAPPPTDIGWLDSLPAFS